MGALIQLCWLVQLQGCHSAIHVGDYGLLNWSAELCLLKLQPIEIDKANYSELAQPIASHESNKDYRGVGVLYCTDLSKKRETQPSKT